MGRFVEGADRDQASFLPARLEDYVSPDNPVRVIDAFVDELDLADLGFARVQPAATGRPGYAPGTVLKLYVYGYLHQLTSSRKLEREAGRNVELMWLIGKLVPDFKTIADFRHDNTGAIQIACQRFVAICRALGLVGGGMVAIDGSRLRAVNTHEKNYTKGKLARSKAHVEESIARYLAELEQADSAETGPAAPQIEHLTERLVALRGRLGELEEIGRQLEASPDGQISLTDRDARAMATGSDHRGVVGYNVQAAVDTKNHIVVANAVTNRGHDRSHLLEMAKAAQAATGSSELTALADRGYYEGEQIRSCAESGIVPMVPKPNTSPAQARGFRGSAQRATYHLTSLILSKTDHSADVRVRRQLVGLNDRGRPHNRLAMRTAQKCACLKISLGGCEDVTSPRQGLRGMTTPTCAALTAPAFHLNTHGLRYENWACAAQHRCSRTAIRCRCSVAR